MDKRKFNGGKSTNAGRKPKAEEQKLIEKLSPLNDAAMEALEAGIKTGQFQFIQLYFNYFYGRPKETKAISINSKESPFINFPTDQFDD